MSLCVTDCLVCRSLLIGIPGSQSHRLIIADDVLIQIDLLMMSTVMLETCREMKWINTWKSVSSWLLARTSSSPLSIVSELSDGSLYSRFFGQSWIYFLLSKHNYFTTNFATVQDLNSASSFVLLNHSFIAVPNCTDSILRVFMFCFLSNVWVLLTDCHWDKVCGGYSIFSLQHYPTDPPHPLIHTISSQQYYHSYKVMPLMPSIYCYDKHIKQNEMGGTCRTSWQMRKIHKILIRTWNRRQHFVQPDSKFKITFIFTI
jgi:hypothetical protein